MSEKHLMPDGEEVDLLVVPAFQRKLFALFKEYGFGEHPVVLVVYNEGHFEIMSNLEEESIPEFLIDVVDTRKVPLRPGTH